MSGVVCAIRGGPNCKSTVAQAITLAKNTHLSLYFLYVVNHDFLSPASNDHTRAVSEKMHQMGQAVLFAVQDKASTLGVASEMVMRHGNVEDEIVGQCHDLEADYVILGCPRDHRRENVFTRDSLEKLGKQIERKIGSQVILSNRSGV